MHGSHRWYFSLIAIFAMTNVLPAHSAFVDIGASLPALTELHLEWGDYDSDGDLDILMVGRNAGPSRIYRNDGGAFTDIQAGLNPVSRGTGAWGDIDGDGDLDLLIAGVEPYIGSRTRIYRNDDGRFIDIEAGLPGVFLCSAAWGDYDNDGDLDLALAGSSEISWFCRIYRNDAGSFTDGDAGLPPIRDGDLAWGDYDNDGDLDLVTSGWSESYSSHTRLFRNDEGTFVDAQAGLRGVQHGSVDWGDKDGDGDLDLLVTGYGDYAARTEIYLNVDGNFGRIATALPDVESSDAAWGDFDNDGDLDLLLAGRLADGRRICRVYENVLGVYVESAEVVPYLESPSVAWGDYDGDGDLDILAGGDGGFGGWQTHVLRNDGVPSNSPPMEPTALEAVVESGHVRFTWDPASDAETPDASLTYNLRVGTRSGGGDVCPAMALTASGHRGVVALGNAQYRQERSLTLPPGTYYWSVQTIDGAFAGSRFAPERSFEVLPREFVPVETALPPLQGGQISWGDFDQDGDLDALVLSGSDTPTTVYRNDGDARFVDVGAGLPGLDLGAAAWGDHDSDGDLDIVLTGLTGGQRITRIYRNEGGEFVSTVGGELPGVSSGAVTWLDADDDGDLDLLLMGIGDGGRFGRLYRNDRGSFEDMASGLPSLSNGAVALADIDADGDVDLALAGRADDGPLALVMCNEGGVFMDAGVALPQVDAAAVDWGDVDGDGAPDLLISGASADGRVARVFRQQAGEFVDFGARLPGVAHGSARWADHDNDGDLDVLLTGDTGAGIISRLFRNDDGVFVDALAGFGGVLEGSALLGDHDGDGDPDVLLCGSTSSDGGHDPFTQLYRNDTAAANTAPSVVSGLTSEVGPGSVTLSWNQGSDDHTPGAALTYNLRMGVVPGGSSTRPSMSEPISGRRMVVQRGNAQQNLSWTLRIPPGTYHWSVQAIDGAYVGGPFATEATFVVTEAATADLEFMPAELPPVVDGTAVWGDYDQDGDLDLLLCGESDSGPSTWILRNEGGSFSDVEAGLPGVAASAAAWGDFDGDGDLDLALSGLTEAGELTRVFRNDAGDFVDVGANLLQLGDGAVAWGDYDQDGDLDLAISGRLRSDRSRGATRLYRNDAGLFTDSGERLGDVYRSALAWGDLDGDGDLDLALSGSVGVFDEITRIYINTDGRFSGDFVSRTGVHSGSLDWGDYDADGDLDLAVSGERWPSDGPPITRIYTNTGRSFETNGSELMGTFDGTTAWGDIDNDGDLDLLVAGETEHGRTTRIYRNEDGSFVDARAEIPAVMSGAALAWGDLNGDASLDLLITGRTGSDEAYPAIARLYRNRANVLNAAPDAPGGLVSQVEGNRVSLSWQSAVDDHTASDGLRYNVRISGSENTVMPDHSDASTGFRRIVGFANVAHGLSHELTLPAGSYEWTVQSVDASYQGSVFAAARRFTVESPLAAYAMVDPGVPAVSDGEAVWGDFDGDEDMDLCVVGLGDDDESVAAIYRNDAGIFVDIDSRLPGVSHSAAAWGDYDSDGDLDLALMGDANGEYVARVYKNESGTFIDLEADIRGAAEGDLAWGDFDSDGDLDLVITGASDTGQSSSIYRYADGTFHDIGAGLEGMTNASVSWADFDADGDLDLLLAGRSESGRATRLYRNEQGIFEDAEVDLVGVEHGATAWADFDADGDSDLALVGYGGSVGRIARVYRNQEGRLQEWDDDLIGIQDGAVAWGDHDNDGDLDLFVCGSTGEEQVSVIYEGDKGTFVASETWLPTAGRSNAAWADYDADGDLDLLLTGETTGDTPMIRICRNDGRGFNLPPTPPGDLVVTVDGDLATFGWSASSDDLTPDSGLSYNLRVVRSPDDSTVLSGMSDPESGFRRIPSAGNAQQQLFGRLRLPAGTYHWSVQAVDDGFLGSGFALAGSFEITTSPVTFTAVGVSLPGVRDGAATWGDIDRDGDLDVLLSGTDASSYVATIYVNDRGAFEPMVQLVPVTESAAAWGDYDNDGDLDLVLTGRSEEARISLVYRNDDGAFAAADTLVGVSGGSVAWGDCDNDGDLDLALAGYGDSGATVRIYENADRTGAGDSHRLIDRDVNLWRVVGGTVSWADYDGDQDLDLLVTGSAPSSFSSGSWLYRNDQAEFELVDTPDWRGVHGKAAWGDYDADGDPDLVITRQDRAGHLYRNDGGEFVDTEIEFTTDGRGTLAWGDYDNDGDLDLLAANGGATDPRVSIYRNDQDSFTAIDAWLPRLQAGHASWLDYDGDGDLDLSLVGALESTPIVDIWRNDGAVLNTAPSPPTGLNARALGNELVLTWIPASDDHTPSEALSYNLRVGTSPGVGDVFTGMAEGREGTRYLVSPGNSGSGAVWRLELPLGEYYWSVQAIDSAFLASRFSEEQTTVSSPSAFRLRQNAPNPFNDGTRIAYDLPAPGKVLLAVYDPRGRRVRVLVDGERPAGYQEVFWDGRDDGGTSVASGMYFVRMAAGGFTESRKIAYVK